MPIGGYSFQPMAPSAGGQGQMSGTAPATPQEAVRILSLRLPRNAPNSPVPSSLLTGAGGGGADINALMRMLMRAFGQGSREMVGPGGPGISDESGVRQGDMGMPRVIPTPRINIGDQGDRARYNVPEFNAPADAPPSGPQAPGDLPMMQLNDLISRQGQPLF